MSFLLSINIPERVSDLITQQAFDQYTISKPSHEFQSRLDELSINDIFADQISDRDMAGCCLSGLWLLHNFLDRSHEISQQIDSAEGSFWHAIMHRLEGDFGNSKYWYRRVGDHPVFNAMSPKGDWDPFIFVDECESAQRSGGAAATSVHQTAVIEWKSLFEFCFNRAY